MNRLRLLPAAAALLGLLVAGCGPGDAGSLGTLPTEPPAGAPTPTPTGEPPASPAPTPPATPPGQPGTSPDARTLTLTLWFTRDGAIVPTSRTRPTTVATSRLALSELAAGPTAAEAAAGLGNGVPADLRFDVHVAAGVATVDLPASFYAGGRAAARLRQAQVVYTLTEFATVDTVGFQVAGEPAGAPVGPAEYADLLPPIVVFGPVIGQRVTSPVTVAGTANVFEATVSVRILDAAGAEVATTFTTATCGSGCRGDYTVTVPYRVSREQPGTVQVYEVSAADGSRIHVVDIPVTLTPP